jgi:hypothetical protein
MEPLGDCYSSINQSNHQLFLTCYIELSFLSCRNPNSPLRFLREDQSLIPGTAIFSHSNLISVLTENSKGSPCCTKFFILI